MGGRSPPSAWIAPLSLRDGTASARGGKGQCPSAEPFPGLLCVILDLGAIGSAVAEAELPCHLLSCRGVIQHLNLRQRGSDLLANCADEKAVSYKKTAFLWSCSDAVLRRVWGSGLPGAHLSGCQGEFLLVKNDSKRPPCVSSNVLNFKE